VTHAGYQPKWSGSDQFVSFVGRTVESVKKNPQKNEDSVVAATKDTDQDESLHVEVARLQFNASDRTIALCIIEDGSAQIGMDDLIIRSPLPGLKIEHRKTQVDVEE
jgi:hypothetical protein